MRLFASEISLRWCRQLLLATLVSVCWVLPAFGQNVTLKSPLVVRGGSTTTTIMFRSADVVTIRWQEANSDLNLKIGQIPGTYGLKSIRMRGDRESSFSPEVVGLPVGVYYGILTNASSNSFTEIQIEASTNPDIRYSTEFLFVVESLVAPRVIAPRGTISDRVPTFQWEPVPGVVSYAVIISSTPFTISLGPSGEPNVEEISPVWLHLTTNTSALYGERTETNPLVEFNPLPLVPGQTYYYTILNAYSKSDPGLLSYVIGNVVSFSLENSGTLAPANLVHPTKNVRLAGEEVTEFSWEPVDGAISYDVSVYERIKDVSAISDVQVFSGNTPNPFITISSKSVFRQSEYRWFVIANDREGAGSVSGFGAFRYAADMGTFEFSTTSSSSGAEILGVVVKGRSTDGGYNPSNRWINSNGSLGIGSTNRLPASVNRKTDGFLSDLSFPANQTPLYTETEFAAIGQPRQISAFWLTWPIKPTVAVGFGYRQPLLFSSSLKLSGFQTLLSGRKEKNTNSIQVDMLAELSLNSAIDLHLDEISVGTGGLLEPYPFGTVWWGITLYRLGASAHFSLDMLPQGVLTISGTEQFYFNDPGDPNLDPLKQETNAFFWKIRGGFQGSGVGARMGLMHRTYLETLGTSLFLDLAPRINMWDGDAFALSYMPRFINLEGVLNSQDPGDKDLLDIELLDLSRPNQTRQTHDAIGQWMNIYTPSTLTAGVDFPMGRHLVVFNFTRFFGSLAVEGEYGLESGVLQKYKLGKKPSWGIKAGIDLGRQERQNGAGSWSIPLRLLTLDVDGVLMELLGNWTKYSNPRYRFSGAVQWGKPVVYGLDNTFSEDLERLLGGMLPTSVSIGRSYTLFDRLDVGVHVVGVPDLLMRFSFGLNVD